MILVRKIILCLVLIISVTSSTFVKAENLRVIKAELGRVIDISEAAQERYKQWGKLFNQVYVKGEIAMENLTPEQKKLLNEFGEDMDFWATETAACSWYCGGGPKKLDASSVLSSQSGNFYLASKAHDFDLRTAWIEGVKGYGIGEYIEYYFEALSPRITEIRVYNGYFKSEKAWEDNSRVKKFKLYINNKPYAILELQNTRAVQKFKVEPLQSKVKNKDLVLKFEIFEVFEGKKWDDVAVSEINFDGLDVHCFIKGTKISMGDGTVKPIDSLQIGDQILTYNIKNQKIEVSTVKELANVIHRNLVKLDFGEITIVSTDDHPYYSKENGWASLNPQKTQIYKNMDKINLLRTGDRVYFLDTNNKLSSKVLKDINYLNQVEETYTIVKLDKNNNFFANGLLVGIEEL
jgi:hypothetical protein